MVRVAAVAAIAVVLVGCTSTSTDTNETTATGPQSVSTVTTRSPSTSIDTTTTMAERTTTTTSTSTTRVPSTTTTTEFTTTSTSPPPALVLRGDGLGIVSFGDPVEDVMAILIDQFGPPSYDQLLESPFELPEGSTGPDRGVIACHIATVPVFGGHTCFDYIRATEWSDVGLGLVFSDLMVAQGGSYFGDPGFRVEVPPSLRGYVYRAGDLGPSARTVEGISVGSTVEDLMALGDRVTFSGPGCGDNVDFTIQDPDSADGRWVSGILVGTDGYAFEDTGYLNPDATVWWLSAGAQRSC